MSMFVRFTRLAPIVAVALVLAACGVGATGSGATPPATAPSPSPTASPSPTDTTAPPGVATARQELASLPVQPALPLTGYSRAQFGQAWADVDHNGCDTRNDILNRDLTQRAWREGTHGCVVVAGVLLDPYTGRTITFTKANAGAVQIDHVVALADAWMTGAQSWPEGTRLLFANDPRELLAVDGPTNERKGDADASQWLPPNAAFRCTYVSIQVEVKVAYHLWVTPAEHDAMDAVLRGCGG